VKTGIQENQLLIDSRSPIGIEDKLSRELTALEAFYETINLEPLTDHFRLSLNNDMTKTETQKSQSKITD